MSYAGFWKRLAAFIIDLIVASIAGAVVIAVVFSVSADTSASTQELQGKLNFISLLVSWIYFAAMESSSMQATLGKMALGIKVTDLSGNRIGFGKATGRFFGKILSGIILLIGYFMAAFTEKKQTLHDIMAGCLVVNK